MVDLFLKDCGGMVYDKTVRNAQILPLEEGLASSSEAAPIAICPSFSMKPLERATPPPLVLSRSCEEESSSFAENAQILMRGSA